MIPDEAVTEARRAIEREFPYDENNEYIVQLVLEAAAPHLMAAAWQKGRSAGQMDPYDRYPAKNPYRSEQ